MAEAGAAVDPDISGNDGIGVDAEVATSQRNLEERSDNVSFMGGRIRFLSDESDSLSPSVSLL